MSVPSFDKYPVPEIDPNDRRHSAMPPRPESDDYGITIDLHVSTGSIEPVANGDGNWWSGPALHDPIEDAPQRGEA